VQYFDSQNDQNCYGKNPGYLLNLYLFFLVESTLTLFCYQGADKYSAAIVESLKPRIHDDSVLEQFQAIQPSGSLAEGTEVLMEISGSKLNYIVDNQVKLVLVFPFDLS